jgi:hypothetical protein
MPRSRKTFWIVSLLLAGCAGAAILAALIANSRPAPELVTLAFVGYTNDSGRKLYVFRGTNGSSRSIDYMAFVQTRDRTG